MHYSSCGILNLEEKNVNVSCVLNLQHLLDVCFKCSLLYSIVWSNDTLFTMNIHFDNSVRETSFHPTYPPHLTTVFHPEIYKRMTRFEEELLNSNLVERKIMEHNNPGSKIFPRISPLKHINPDLKPNEIDLTTTGHHSHMNDYYTCLSPRFYGKKEIKEYSPRCGSPPVVFRDKHKKSTYCPVLVQVRDRSWSAVKMAIHTISK